MLIFDVYKISNTSNATYERSVSMIKITVQEFVNPMQAVLIALFVLITPCTSNNNKLQQTRGSSNGNGNVPFVQAKHAFRLDNL